MSIEDSSGPSTEQAQKGRDNVVLGTSLTIAIVLSSFTNETMPWRHRGQAIEPGGPATVEHRFVEQRYKAQWVQNSWKQPASFVIIIIITNICIHVQKCVIQANEMCGRKRGH